MWGAPASLRSFRLRVTPAVRVATVKRLVSRLTSGYDSTCTDDESGPRQVLIVHLGVTALFLMYASQSAASDTYNLPLLPSASDPSRQGFVRIVNHSAVAGDVNITAIDDDGLYYGPETVTVEPLAAFHFSSANLEQGHEALGLNGIGSGNGDWRLVLDSDLQIEPLAYSQSSGFIDRLHDVEVRDSFYHRIALPAPGDSYTDGGTLRLTNLGYAEAEIVIFGLDDSGTPSLRRAPSC